MFIFDNEEITKYIEYVVKELKDGYLEINADVNADVNGSYNIMKKAIPNVQYTNGIEGLGVNPLLLNIKR